jgi:hypothetical protein
MPRKQTSEKDLVVTARTAAAPARRKSAATPRKVRAVETPAPSLAAVSEVVAIVSTEPTYDQIASLAYALWEARGCQGGSPESDWLAAEQQLRARA